MRSEIFGGDEGVRSGVECARRHRSRRGHVMHLRPGLRRADAVDDDGVRQNVDQALLDERRQQRAAVGDHGQRRHVRDALLDGGDQRPGHGVADHRHHHDLLPLDRADHVVGIQMVDDRREDDGLPGRERRHHAPLRRAVDQRRQDHQLGAAGPRRTLATISSSEPAGSPVMRFRPPNDVMKMSCWRHSTPFGIPVVPPV